MQHIGALAKLLHPFSSLRDRVFGYKFVIQYDMSMEIPAKANGANQVLLAELKYTIKYKIDPECVEITDTFNYSEWFRLQTNGRTPGTKTVDAFQNNKPTKKGQVDTQMISPEKDICCGSVSAVIEYGLSDEFKDPVRETGQFGLSDLGKKGGRFSNTWTHTQGWKLIPMKIKGNRSTWSFNYNFAKGDGCCKTKEYVETIVTEKVEK